MSTEAIGAYSPDTIYGQLTSPFTPHQIKINAHTPYDKVDESESKVYSRTYFKSKPQAKMIYELPDNRNTGFPTKFESADDKDKEENSIEVTGFQASSTSSKDIVQNSLKHGYTTEQAVAVTKAQNAYQKSAVLTTDPAGVLSTCAYKVV